MVSLSNVKEQFTLLLSAPVFLLSVESGETLTMFAAFSRQHGSDLISVLQTLCCPADRQPEGQQHTLTPTQTHTNDPNVQVRRANQHHALLR